MHRIFTTDDVHPRDRFEYWHDIACTRIVLHDSRPADRQSFEAELSEVLCADVSIFMVEISPLLVEHTRQHVSREPEDSVLLLQKVSGELRLAQGDREARLGTGDMGLLDPMRPYSAAYGERSRAIVVKLPRDRLQIRIGEIENLTARRIAAVGETALTSTYLKAIAEHAGTIGSASASAVSNQLLDLLALGVTHQTTCFGTSLAATSHAHVARLRSFIALNLTKPSLDPEGVARAVGIGLRHANRLLAASGTSVAGLIQSMRLARCKAAFEDIGQSFRTISEIAYGWGFTDMTHFARRFRAAYGCSPSECRRSNDGSNTAHIRLATQSSSRLM